MKRLLRLTPELAAALIGWSAIGAMIVAAVGSRLASTSGGRDGRPWILLWSLFYVPILIWSVISGQYMTGLGLLGLAAFGAGAGVVLGATAAARQLKWWIVGGLATLAIASIGVAYIQPRSLQPYEGAEVRTRVTVQGLIERVSTSQEGATAHRSWLHAGGDGYRLTGYLRAARGNSSTPSSVTITLDWPGRTIRAQTSLAPRRDWRLFQVQVSESDVGDPEFLILRLYSSEPGSVEWRSIKLEALAGPQPRAPRSARQALMTEHPVLLAHLSIVLTMALIAASGFSIPSLIGMMAATIIGLTSGTRSALAVISIWSMLVPLSQTWRPARKIAAIILIVGVGIGAALITQEARSDALSAAPSRTTIWAVALEAFVQSPILGLEGTGAHSVDYFREHTSPPASHAHNLLLQFATAYGIFGAAAIVLLMGGLLVLSYRYAGPRGIVIILPLFVLNFFDATLFDARILVATMLTMNVLAKRDRLPSHELHNRWKRTQSGGSMK